MATDWEISRTTGRCAVTQRPLAEGEFYFAALFETPDGFERRDYAEQSWNGPPEGCFCCWRGRIPTRDRKPSTVAVDKEMLVQLFTRLEDAESEAQQQFRFMLALLLMRKRVLKLENTVEEQGQEYWELRPAGEETKHRVANPRLTPEQIDRLNARVLAVLGGDLVAIEQLNEEEPDAGQPQACTDEQAGGQTQ